MDQMTLKAEASKFRQILMISHHKKTNPTLTHFFSPHWRDLFRKWLHCRVRFGHTNNDVE
jgi:hypothetical protein